MEQKKLVFSVSQAVQKIRQRLESSFPSLWIKGEVSNFIAHGSGHWYFSLKDGQAQIKAVMFRGHNQRLSFQPKNGDEVILEGEVSLYPPRGDCQIIGHWMEQLGSGLLQQAFERLKKKLEAEGLFDPKKKKPLPPFPRHVAIISSPTGAAVRDILQILKNRWRGLKVTLIPALVQGETAPHSLIKGLKSAKKLKPDVLIIGRGGGSIEDLQAFNDEALARAISAHPIPIISAIGHEIDFTISDFSADVRAETPSSAAVMVVKSAEEFLQKLSRLERQSFQHIQLKLKALKEKLFTLEKSLIRPDRLIQDLLQKTDDAMLRLSRAFRQVIEKKGVELDSHLKVLKSLNPKTVMERGFSIVSREGGEVLKSAETLKVKDPIHIHFFKGEARASITKKGE